MPNLDRNVIASITKTIGIFFVSAVVLGIPVIFTLSIVFSWPGFVMFLSGVILFAEYILVATVIDTLEDDQ